MVENQGWKERAQSATPVRRGLPRYSIPHRQSGQLSRLHTIGVSYNLVFMGCPIVISRSTRIDTIPALKYPCETTKWTILGLKTWYCLLEKINLKRLKRPAKSGKYNIKRGFGMNFDTYERWKLTHSVPFRGGVILWANWQKCSILLCVKHLSW